MNFFLFKRLVPFLNVSAFDWSNAILLNPDLMNNLTQCRPVRGGMLDQILTLKELSSRSSSGSKWQQLRHPTTQIIVVSEYASDSDSQTFLRILRESGSLMLLSVPFSASVLCSPNDIV